jgi:hypothetical protein
VINSIFAMQSSGLTSAVHNLSTLTRFLAHELQLSPCP